MGSNFTAALSQSSVRHEKSTRNAIRRGLWVALIVVIGVPVEGSTATTVTSS
ncbi:hypothetical protein G5T42_05130 [Microbacterium sp. 4R-513]|uniref:hypothetical protein n=1 Tax=Microbacterium sp. 4R-513 TaxID=2567934 RepID=UPI0013E1C028|nr:hypothetical protein [Microbacterium sp. 4R-513]QIG38947.1 hypothetical protein G5T42_05130 [Microbacterium sp. 4R-513]